MSAGPPPTLRSRHTQTEITFNLMAVVGDRKEKFLKQIAELPKVSAGGEVRC